MLREALFEIVLVKFRWTFDGARILIAWLKVIVLCFSLGPNLPTACRCAKGCLKRW